MHSNVTVQNWIDHLRYLMPPQGVVHIGAGSGISATRYASWPVNTTVLIEADECYSHKLALAVSGNKGWSAHTAMISDKGGEAVYYNVSNPSESGSLPPEVLTKLWRNLKVIDERRLITTTLERLLTLANIQPDCLNWLVIDCLPALPVLQGAGRYNDGWDVIIARVLLDENLFPGNGATKIELDLYLAVLGYRCIFIEEECQPAMANALYVRDWKVSQNKFLESQGIIQQLTQTLDERIKLAAEHQMKIQQLTQALYEHTKLAEEHQVQIHQLTQARDEQAKLVTDHQAQIQTLTLLCDQKTQNLSENQVQLEQVTQAKSEQSKAVADLQVKIQQLAQERDQQINLLAEKLSSTIAESTEELRQARQTASLAIKFQTLREADLDDLQIRYKDAVNVQEQQHLLMLQLEDKLRLAAQYFHQLRDTAVSPIVVTSENAHLEKPVRKRVTMKQKAGKTGHA